MLSSLRMLNIDVTNKCNLSCEHCGRKENSSKDELSFKDIVSLLRQAAELRCGDVTFAGGEPFIRKDMFELLEETEKLGMSTTILTNGTLIDKNTAIKLGKIPNLAYVRISLDYADETRMAQFRGMTGITKKIETAVGNLKDQGIVVGLGTTLMPDNMDQLDKILEFAIKNEINFVRLAPVSRIGKAKDWVIDQAFLVDAVKAVLLSISKSGREVSLEYMRVPDNIREIGRLLGSPCPADLIMCHVSPFGDVSGCPMTQGFNNGHNIKITPFTELWKQRLMSSIERRQNMPTMFKGRCGTCEMKQGCQGGCMAEKFTRGYAMEDEQPLCVPLALEEALSDKSIFTDPAIRRVLSGILSRQSINKECGLPPCVRSSPLWVYPIINDVRN